MALAGDRCAMRLSVDSLTRWLVALAVSILLAAPAVAQPEDVLLSGRVQWIAGQKMLLLPRSGGVPVNVDLVQVPLEQYAGLTQGSQVRVDGVISNDGRRVLATSVVALAASESERR